MLALGLGANLYPRDRETRTVMPLVAVPLARWQYLLGRFFGAALVQAAALLVSCLGLMLILLFNGMPIPGNLLPATLLILVEGWFLLSTVFFFSFFASPPAELAPYHHALHREPDERYPVHRPDALRPGADANTEASPSPRRRVPYQGSNSPRFPHRACVFPRGHLLRPVLLRLHALPGPGGLQGA